MEPPFLKQILQSLKDGKIEVARIPTPRVGRGQLPTGTAQTLVSSRDKYMLVQFGEANWLEKACQQPLQGQGGTGSDPYRWPAASS